MGLAESLSFNAASVRAFAQILVEDLNIIVFWLGMAVYQTLLAYCAPSQPAHKVWKVTRKKERKKENNKQTGKKNHKEKAKYC